MEYLEKLDQQTFESGLDIERYVSELRNYRSFVKGLMEEAKAHPQHVEQLKSAASRHPQPVRATVNTEDWCGDWACTLPVLHSLFSGAGIPFRVFRGSEHPAMKERYERDGDDHIPALSLWDGNGNEILRWIEAPARVIKKKDEWEREHPEFQELYKKQDEDKEARKQFAKLYRELLETMADWYRTGMWEETTREIVEKLGSSTETAGSGTAGSTAGGS
jgi:hypothetical protein